jgi:hypothetical protein
MPGAVIENGVHCGRATAGVRAKAPPRRHDRYRRVEQSRKPLNTAGLCAALVRSSDEYSAGGGVGLAKRAGGRDKSIGGPGPRCLCRGDAWSAAPLGERSLSRERRRGSLTAGRRLLPDGAARRSDARFATPALARECCFRPVAAAWPRVLLRRRSGCGSVAWTRLPLPRFASAARTQA